MMMDMSSLVDGALVIFGVVATLVMGVGTVFSDATTMSTNSQTESDAADLEKLSALPKAA